MSSRREKLLKDILPLFAFVLHYISEVNTIMFMPFSLPSTPQ